MSEFKLESGSMVNTANRNDSAIHDEIYHPSNWSSFDKLNTASGGSQNSQYLDFAKDPYETSTQGMEAPKIGDPNRFDFRQNSQQRAIFNGIEAGNIDFNEYSDLEKEQNLISNAQQYFGADGFTENELKTLDMMQNAARMDILAAGGGDEVNPEPPGSYGADTGGEDNGGSDSGGSGGSDSGGSDSGSSPESNNCPPSDSNCPPEDSGSSPDASGAQQLMSILDQNGDGQISLQEFLQAFQDMDANHDGVISPEEFQQFMKDHAEHPQDTAAKDGGHDTGKTSHSSDTGGQSGKDAGQEVKPSGADSSNSSGEKSNAGDSPSDTASTTTPVKGSLDDVLAQNDFNRRGLITADAPFHGENGGAYGKVDGYDKPVKDQFKVGPWGVVYPEEGKSVDPSANVQVKDASTYFHLKDGGWVEAQSPNDSNWWEGNFPANFKGKSQQGRGNEMLSDGSMQFGSPPSGMNDHFGPGSPSVTYDTNKYDGVFTTFSARTDKDNSGMVMQIGIDHYDQKLGQGDSSYSPAFGASNWTRLSKDWQPLYYTSLDSKTIANDPPPGIS